MEKGDSPPMTMHGVSMSQPLFRDEVLKARRTRWLGGISLAQPLRLWILTGLAVMAASAIVLFVTLGTYTRRSTVTGQLVPTKGLATVVAPASGVVTRMDVAEGGRSPPAARWRRSPCRVPPKAAATRRRPWNSTCSNGRMVWSLHNRPSTHSCGRRRWAAAGPAQAQRRQHPRRRP